MNIYTGLLFQHGYIHDVKLAMSLAGFEPDKTPDPPGNSRYARSVPGRRTSPRAPFRRNGFYSACATACLPFR